MSGIFVSYRRHDSQSAAGRLTDFLERSFGREQIFRDVETLEPGVDFVKAIDKAIASSQVMLVVIGPRWLTIADKDGRRRLDQPGDWIRLETAAALRRDIRVIPVLVEDARPPAETDLPDEIKSLARREAHELSDKRWDYDVEQLTGALERIPGIRRRPLQAEPRRREQDAPKAKSAFTSKIVKSLAVIGAIFLAVLLFGAILSETASPPTTLLPPGAIPQPAPMPTTLASGMPTSACGCWGPVAPGATRPNPRCASGMDMARMCAGVCPAGGMQWQSVCR